MICPVAWRNPVRSAAPLPWLRSWKTIFRSPSRLLHLAEDLARAVGRAVVDHDDLLADRDGADPAEDLVDAPLLVVGGDDDREHQVVGDAEDPQLAAEGLAQRLDQPLPAFGVAGEAADGRIEARARSGIERSSVSIEARCLGDLVSRANIHRVRILPASARPAAASGSLHRGRPRVCGQAGASSAKVDTVQDKRRAGSREAGLQASGGPERSARAAGPGFRKGQGRPPFKGSGPAVASDSE